MNQTTVSQMIVKPSKTTVDWFSRFKPEDEKGFKELDIKESKAVMHAKWVLREVLRTATGPHRTDQILSFMAGIKCTSQDIMKFSLALSEFQHLKRFRMEAGLFLSTLINDSNDKKFTVFTKHLEEPLSFLGTKNTKEITVEGDVGCEVGDSMRWGLIHIKGNVGHSVGRVMHNGTIVVEGNAGPYVGDHMYDGTIYLQGEFGSIEDSIRGGKIYHKGILIRHVGNERRLI